LDRNTEDGFFIVTRIHRDDLRMLGFDTSNTSDEDMERLAERMENDYVEQLYWSSMEILAEDLVPRKTE
jgi:hypothetical protein